MPVWTGEVEDRNPLHPHARKKRSCRKTTDHTVFRDRSAARITREQLAGAYQAEKLPGCLVQRVGHHFGSEFKHRRKSQGSFIDLHVAMQLETVWRIGCQVSQQLHPGITNGQFVGRV